MSMGVYIKDMEMPTSCFECNLRKVWDDGIQCLVNKGIWMDADGKHGCCPLVEVETHGDLIDRDKLEKDIDKYIGGEESRSRFHHWVQVQNAVIPMDKEADT